MKTVQDVWKHRIHAALSAMWPSTAPALTSGEIVAEVPPKPEMGDLAFPLFSYAKVLRQGPPVLAKQVVAALEPFASEAEVFALGAYVNLRYARSAMSAAILKEVQAAGQNWGRTEALAGAKVMVEFSSPNTNKPLHIGHLRNNTLGESVSRILAAAGAEVHKVNLINDRGVHICKSMLAYQKFGEGRTPESEGVKPDRFVGDYYVKFAKWAETDDTAEAQAQELLVKWEAGDPEVRRLWAVMNGWALEGVGQTYRRQGVAFDRLYKESETYLLGKDVILKGLEKGVFRKRDDGAVVIDLPWKDRAEDEANAVKVMLRPDGTSIYITQDLGTAVSRHADWPFNELVYVVANEQDYHFRVLFHVLRQLGYDWTDRLFHLSYGMVKLPDGSRIKSRSGTTADADDILDDLRDGALEEIRSKGREDEVDDIDATAESIALAALHYFLLQATPAKDMIFDPKESLSFNGNTGPYLQYVGARISSIEAAAADPSDTRALLTAPWDASILTNAEEWELIKLVGRFPDVVEESARLKDPSVVAVFTYELAKAFSKFYHDHKIIKAEDVLVAASRLRLAQAVLQVLRNAFELLNIPFLRSM
jgi:arginyl-tRNA synthetase